MLVDNGDGTFSIKSSYSFEKQEPVAWIDPKELDMDVSTTVTKNKQFDSDIPLYTAPLTNIKFNQTLECPSYLSGLAPRELSDEEIKAIELQISEGVACYDDFDFVAFARTILKKASEK